MSDFDSGGTETLGAGSFPFQGNGSDITTRIYAGPTAGTFDANDSLNGSNWYGSNW